MLTSNRSDANRGVHPIHPSGSDRRIYSKKVRQDTSRENWLRRALIFLLIVWMTVAVLLPVYQLIDQSLHAEITVAIWGPEDVRIGGRRVYIENGQIIIDQTAFGLDDGTFSHDGLEATVKNEKIVTVFCRTWTAISFTSRSCLVSRSRSSRE